jgi:septal ring factor EnvC (AmiA/AmiB activator)
VADRARALVAELEASGAAPELVGPAVGRAKQALSQAEAASPARAPGLEETALEWAEVARDLVRASEAERASDALEQEASSLATEIARLRAAVEQAMARVGRARQDLKELEASSSTRAASPPVAPGNSGPSPTVAAPAKVGNVAPAQPSPAPAKQGTATAPPSRAPGESAPASGERK